MDDGWLTRHPLVATPYSAKENDREALHFSSLTQCPQGGRRHRSSALTDIEPALIRLQNGEHRQPDYLAINPMGKVPALRDGDLLL